MASGLSEPVSEFDVYVTVAVRPPKGVSRESIAQDMQVILDMGADQARKLLRLPEWRHYDSVVRDVKGAS